jgi:NADPH:quinone reductase-like Zn-dependent oxidoreductase
VAGHVESVGKNVTQFQPGDEVFGETSRQWQWHNGGAYAEYVSVPEDTLALKPAGITFEQAAAVPSSGFIALSGLRNQGQVQPGQKVLINGAGGGVGALAVQLAKAYGADVTGVDSTRKLDMVQSIGADQVIDYTQEDFTQSGERYDLILDVPGNHSLSECRRALTPEGTYVLIGHDHFGVSGGRWLGSLPRFFKLVVMSPFVSQLPDRSRDTPRPKAHTRAATTKPTSSPWPPRMRQRDPQHCHHHDALARARPPEARVILTSIARGSERCHHVLLTPL